jgi:UPF0716 protein FxsA
MRFELIPLVLLLLWAYAEFTLLVFVAKRVGTLYALLLTLMMGAAGVVIARAQGWRLVQRLRQEWMTGEMPLGALLDGFLVFIAGVLLLVPGFLSDAVGLLLLVPPVRALLAWLVTVWWRRRKRRRTDDSLILEGQIVPDDEVRE